MSHVIARVLAGFALFVVAWFATFWWLPSNPRDKGHAGEAILAALFALVVESLYIAVLLW